MYLILRAHLFAFSSGTVQLYLFGWPSKPLPRWLSRENWVSLQSGAAIPWGAYLFHTPLIPSASLAGYLKVCKVKRWRDKMPLNVKKVPIGFHIRNKNNHKTFCNDSCFAFLAAWFNMCFIKLHKRLYMKRRECLRRECLRRECLRRECVFLKGV